MSSQKKNKKLHLVKGCSTVKKNNAISTAKQELTEAIRETVGDTSVYEKNHLPLVETICSLVENIDTIKLTGTEKKDLVVDAIVTLVPVLNNDKDREVIQHSIDYVCENKLIKKISTSKLIAKSCLSFLLKKVLN